MTNKIIWLDEIWKILCGSIIIVIIVLKWQENVIGFNEAIESDIEDEGVPGENDFEQEAEWTYILGKDPTSVPPNNPPKIMTVHNKIESGKNSILEHYPLDTDMLEGPEAETNYRFPIYIRLEGTDQSFSFMFIKGSNYKRTI